MAEDNRYNIERTRVIMKWHGKNRKRLCHSIHLLVNGHVVFPNKTVRPPRLRPRPRKHAALQEPLAGILAESMRASKPSSGDGLNQVLEPSLELLLEEPRVEDKRLIPITLEHPTRGVHRNGGDQARLGAQESMIQKADFHEELG